MKTTTQHLATNAAWLTQAWPQLNELKTPGTPPRWKEIELNDPQPHTGNKTPINITLLDLTTAITHDATTTANLIQNTGLNAKPTNNTTPAHLTYIATYANILNPDDPHTIHAEHQLRTHRQTAQAHLATHIEGQRLKTNCPWCNQPHLRIRAIGPDTNPETVITCESGTCQPPEADCGTWYHGNPCWPFHEWQWLSQRIAWADDRGRRTQTTTLNTHTHAH